MKNLKLSILLITAVAFTTVSCKKYKKYDDGEVIENTYSGNVTVTSTGTNPGGDITGSDDSGEYSFVWTNASSKAELNFDRGGSAGTIQIIIKDAKGNEVLNKTRPENGEDSFSGVSEEGKSGNWLVTIITTGLKGDGTYSLTPKE